MYGPKKRGPKPKTLMLKARAHGGPGSSRILPLRQQQQQPPKPSPRLPSSSPSSSSSSFPSSAPSSSFPSSAPSSSALSNAKLQSGATQHKLKKDIHRCHRMSRRPLARPNPLSQQMGTSVPLSARTPSFSESVRILNRKVNREVKPREVKRGRIILNLKVLDKPGSGANSITKAPTNQRVHQGQDPGRMASLAGRQTVPSQNRVIGKTPRRFGQVTYRGPQTELRVPTFPLSSRRTVGAQQPNADPTLDPGLVGRPGRPSGSGTTTSSTFSAPPTNPSAVPGPDPTRPGHHKAASSSLAQTQEPHLLAERASCRPSSDCEDTRHAVGDSSSQLSSSPLGSSSPTSSSSTCDDGVQILDLSLTPGDTVSGGCHSDLLHHHRRRCQNDFSSEPHYCGEVSEGGDGDEADWHPEMTVRCANVVVTDVTTNLLTVTIKEFCPPQLPASPADATQPPQAKP